MKVGTCGFPVSRNKLYLALDAVELQETFYNVPDRERMKRLRNEAPPYFEFTVKVFQGLTHGPNSPTMKRVVNFKPENDTGNLKSTEKNFELWNEFKNAVQPLEPSCFVFQTPPSFGSEDDLMSALEFFNVIGGPKICWEPRGKSFDNISLLKKIFDKTGIVHVHDPFRRTHLVINDILYVRLHGKGTGETNYGYRYTEEDLINLKGMLMGKNAYVMFNNVHMYKNAIRFKELI